MGHLVSGATTLPLRCSGAHYILFSAHNLLSGAHHMVSIAHHLGSGAHHTVSGEPFRGFEGLFL